MAEQSSEDIFIQDWVKKQLESGDDPEILKTVLKNRGMNSGVVDLVRSSLKKGPQDKKSDHMLIQPKKEFMNIGLKKEVDDIIFSSNVPKADSAESADSKELKAEAKKDARKNKAPELKKESEREEKLSEKAEIIESQKIAVRSNQFQQSPEKSILSLFLDRVRVFMSGIKLGSPKITEYFFDTRVVILAGIAVAILIIALLISFGLNWYADWAARSVLT
ncbi:MAG: hypothetical protein ABIF85_07155 [Nanoarchaeota archaeon]|nr:hypothetical protein [Nanoarchaeota archaeon]MBU4300988.1 hypothetical protein [Nanoarchaeota archaeon]MBU4451194.1 hypothetical protein [Nanoarchaeota archaeon]MCG2723175.1 hypothetical protein [archaeon]